MNAIDTKMADALRREGRGFGPGGAGAPPLPAPPIKVPPRTIREGDVLLGAASNADQIGLSLGKLIDGRLLIQGNSGAGKSMLLRRLFEQAFGRIQQLVLDRDGEFSTLAEKFDVAVLTAADVRRIGGESFALHLREHRYSAVLDLSDATSEDCVSLVADIVTGLVEAPQQHWHPMLVISDETQTLIPRYDPGDVEPATRKRNIRAFADMMGRGRKRGIAGILATSRIAETATPVVSKATNIIVGRTIFDRDLERAGAVLGMTVGSSRVLRGLADGEFIGIGPAFNIAGKVRFKSGSVQSTHAGVAPEVVAPPSISAAAAAELVRSVPEPQTPSTPQGGTGYQPPAKPDHKGKGRFWSEAEDQILRNGYRNNVLVADIAGQLADAGYRERTVGAVYVRANALGLISKARSVNADWTPAEDQIVIDGYADKDVKIMEIVARLAEAGFDRGRVSVQMRAIGLGITRDRVNYYSEKETEIALAGLKAKKSNREIIIDLKKAGFHRGVTSISKFAQKHGFDRSAEDWTDEQIKTLRQMYADRRPVREMVAAIGKTIGAIRARASHLGLKQRDAYSDADFETLQKFYRTGKTLSQVVKALKRPYANVARVAISIGLNFSIVPTERGKAASLLKAPKKIAAAKAAAKKKRAAKKGKRK